MRRKKREVVISRFDAPVLDDEEYYPSSLDLIHVAEPNPVTAGIQHNEPRGRNTLCNFGCQTDHRDMCDVYRRNSHCLDDQRAGWAFPDCHKMLSQHDGASVADVIELYTVKVFCCRCNRETLKYECYQDPEDNSEWICRECFDDEYFICDGCHKVFTLDEEETLDDYHLCGDCYSSAAICDDCGGLIDTDRDDYWTDDDHTYCEDCMDDNTFVCASCDDRYHNDCAHDDDHGTILCDSCREEYYYCEDCNRWINPDDGDYHTTRDEQILCSDCYREYRQSRGLHDHGYAPYLRFLKRSDEDHPVKFFGLELEVDNGNTDAAEELGEIRGIFLTEDGSLTRNGIEIVSHPATLKYHMEEFPWEEITTICKRYGYKSHYGHNGDGTLNCGLHVHISKKAFGNNEQEMDKNVAKLLYLTEKWWDKVVKFSRRSSGSLDRWAARYHTINHAQDDDREIINKAKRMNGSSRYMCINLRPMDTIEVRMFRGSLNPNTIKATIQFCDLITEMAINNDLETVQKFGWEDLRNQAMEKQYDVLIDYLNRRDL